MYCELIETNLSKIRLESIGFYDIQIHFAKKRYLLISKITGLELVLEIKIENL